MGFWVQGDRIFVEGIEKLTANDICFARRLGYVIKLLGIIKADPDGQIEVRCIRRSCPRSTCSRVSSGVFNALAVKGDVVGESLFYGRGAGQDATASAVIGDLAEAADALQSPRRNLGFMPHGLTALASRSTRSSRSITCASPSRIGPGSSRKSRASSASKTSASPRFSNPKVMKVRRFPWCYDSQASNGQMSAALRDRRAGLREEGAADDPRRALQLKRIARRPGFESGPLAVFENPQPMFQRPVGKCQRVNDPIHDPLPIGFATALPVKTSSFLEIVYVPVALAGPRNASR
jgi:hypothetical protein